MNEIKILEPRPGVKIAIVEVPDSSREFKVFNDERPYLSFFEGHTTPRIYLALGEYNVLGLSTELTEEQCRSILPIQDEHPDFDYWFDYTEKEPRMFRLTAKESFASFMLANGFVDRNPLQSSEPTKDLSFYDSEDQYLIAINQWQEAQSKVRKYLILKIVE